MRTCVLGVAYLRMQQQSHELALCVFRGMSDRPAVTFLV